MEDGLHASCQEPLVRRIFLRMDDIVNELILFSLVCGGGGVIVFLPDKFHLPTHAHERVHRVHQ